MNFTTKICLNSRKPRGFLFSWGGGKKPQNPKLQEIRILGQLIDIVQFLQRAQSTWYCLRANVLILVLRELRYRIRNTNFSLRWTQLPVETGSADPSRGRAAVRRCTCLVSHPAPKRPFLICSVCFRGVIVWPHSSRH